MASPWSSTVSILSGGAAVVPRQWPAAQTRRVELWERPVPRGRSSDVTDLERSVLRLLVERTLNGGEVAYALGITLESAYSRISQLHARGLVGKRGRNWECTPAGRSAAQPS
jgi:hypothetical protein